MPISQKDIQFYLSAPGARQGFVGPGSPEGSLGGYVSTTPLSADPMNNLFQDVRGEANEAGVTDYRCVFVRNAHTRLTLRDAKVWVEPVAGTDITIGVDPVGPIRENVSARQAVGPGGVEFLPAYGKGSALSLGNLPPESVAAVWVMRRVRQAEPSNGVGFALRIVGETLQ
jgi:hypothetical protein